MPRYGMYSRYACPIWYTHTCQVLYAILTHVMLHALVTLTVLVYVCYMYAMPILYAILTLYYKPSIM